MRCPATNIPCPGASGPPGVAAGPRCAGATLDGQGGTSHRLCRSQKQQHSTDDSGPVAPAIRPTGPFLLGRLVAAMDTKALLDSLDLGVVVIAPDWTIAEWSAAAARITGLAADRAVGRNFWAAFPAAKGTHVEQTLQDVLADGQPRTVLAPAGPAEVPALV